MTQPSAAASFSGLRRSVPRGVLLATAALLAVVSSPPAAGQLTRVANTTLTLPQDPQTYGYSTTNAFPGLTFSQPLGLVTPPGETDRLFVVEKTGRIQVLSGLSTTPVKQLFLDLSARVLTSSEQGLLGLAFHPDFASNRYFYVFYSITATTAAGTGAHQRVARFTALPAPATNAQILATEVPLISQFDEADNHNGGDLHFGPDGYLYVALGDEGGGNDQFNNSQRIDKDFFAGLLRIDVDLREGNLLPNTHPAVHAGAYRVPADNPFVGATAFNGSTVTPSAVRTEFWAVGLRNPWRFSFDRPTGRLFAGDVGQGAREEIDLVTRGGNYGWSYREGTIAGPRSNPPVAASFIDPIWDIGRSQAASITGGVVYRGTRFAQLYGQYVFGDYQQNRVFAMAFPLSGPVQVQQIATESTPAGFGVDPRNGDILIASIGGGVIRRLIYNTTPTGTPLPATLTATGAFSSIAALTPAAGVIAYEPNVSFWSDHAKKARWFSVPALADKIIFAADGNWSFPAGTVWVKHFDLELTRGDPASARRLETRFLVKTAGGVYGVTYRWNTAQTEATLVPEEGADETIAINDAGTIRTQTWRYPSRAECLQCHTPSGGHALSFNTAQLNRSRAYASGAANQLTALAGAGYFAGVVPDPSTLRALAPADDASATLEHRVRSYLAANCVQCHQPGGTALGNWDARIATPTGSTGLVNGLLVNSAGVGANRVIAPADPAHSMLLSRISTRGNGQMPPLASSELDAAGIALVTAWINALGPPVFTLQPGNRRVGIGASVSFTAAASGTPAPAYQWKKDGVNLPGATSATLTLTNVQAGDAGSYVVVATNANGTATSSVAVLSVGSPALDFNGDNQPDLLWQNLTTGARRIWLMNGTVKAGEVPLGTVSPDWLIAGSADFNADGQPDILWQNLATGERGLWLMNGANVAGFITLGTVPTAWHIAGTADFNGDGYADILWENTLTGERGIWLMLGTALSGWMPLGTIGRQWSMAGTGEFNHDNQPDIVLQNTLTGERKVWLMNGTARGSEVSLGFVALEWSVGALADYNLDGDTDIVWQNTVTGEHGVWLMSGTGLAGYVPLPADTTQWIAGRTPRRPAAMDFNQDGQSDILWRMGNNSGSRKITLMNGTIKTGEASLGYVIYFWDMSAAADMNGDGQYDIILRNKYTGECGVWLMTGTNVVQYVSLGTVPTGWKIVDAADFNGDNQPDILWQNTVTGECGVWLMSGTSLSGYATITTPLAGSWRMACAADFNRDGRPDIVLQNALTGEHKLWLMNGADLGSEVALGTTGLEWSIVGAADYNGDGNSDILWQSSVTGVCGVWLMNGTGLSGYIPLSPAEAGWVVERTDLGSGL